MGVMRQHRVLMDIKRTLDAIATKTWLVPAYRRYADHRRTQQNLQRFKEWTDEDQNRLHFYQQFIAAGDVVFDVGANLGNRAKVFSKLDAVVVAVEPQVACADFLQVAFDTSTNFHLVRKALGSSVGEAEMLISDANTISSLSPDWVRSVKDSGRFATYRWDRKQTVSVDTLDNLIAEYGCPAFIKIDVEGFEDHVIAGLSTPVAAISMEFTPEYLESTRKCIRHLEGIANWEFQLSLGESMTFALPKWVNASQVDKALSQVSSSAFGDLYARLA